MYTDVRMKKKEREKEEGIGIRLLLRMTNISRTTDCTIGNQFVHHLLLLIVHI